MFRKSEGMGDVGFTIPMCVRVVEPGKIEMVDPSQQMNLLLFNFSKYTVRARLWANGVEKESFILGPHDRNACIGENGSCQIFALIFVSLTNLPEFANTANNSKVVGFTNDEWVEIKGEFEVVETGERVSVMSLFRFALPENATPWHEAV